MAASNVMDPIVDREWHHVDGIYTVDSALDHTVESGPTWEVTPRLNSIFLQPERVARLEFVWDGRKKGVIAVGTRDNVLVHITEAILGYEGSGPSLSKDILHFFGVSDEVFEMIQDAAWNARPYLVSLGRTGPSSWSWSRIR